MPGQNYSEIAAKLKAAGLAGETPCAIISRATTRHQRTHHSTIAELTRSPRLAAPTLLVVGEVVRFADTAALAQNFVVPTISKNSDSAALFASFPSQVADFEKDEEPIA